MSIVHTHVSQCIISEGTILAFWRRWCVQVTAGLQNRCIFDVKIAPALNLRAYLFLFTSSLSPPSFLTGGLGEGVAGALSEETNIRIRRLAVTDIPRSGPGAVLMDMYGISANHIVKAVKDLLA